MAPPATCAAAEARDGGSAPAPSKTGVLFVCLGNICRSPTAEAVFRSVVERRGLADKFDIDSCGTGGGASNVSAVFFLASGFWGHRVVLALSLALSLSRPETQPSSPPLLPSSNPPPKQWYKDGGFSYHEGDPADARMAAAAAKRGVKLTSRSRPLVPADWSRFAHVVCMDADNVRAVETAVRHWGNPPGSPRLSLMTEWAAEGSESRRLGKVPDPYYGGPAGFDKVLDLLDEAAEGLLNAVLAEEEGERAAAGRP